jgi:ubiquitin-conjugating enzyme E2 Z
MSLSLETNVVISKESIQRLIRDIKEITKNPLSENGIYYKHHDEDMLKGYAMIVGPSETPYFGGYYFFDISYPCDYPHSPPTIKYCTNGDNIRFNPNLYVSGKVCISLLNTWRGEQWTSCQTISTVLLTLCTLLCKEPLINEPGVTREHKDFEKYAKIIDFKNIEIAHLQMLQKKEGIFMKEFEEFYPIMEEHFNKNYVDLLKYLEEKTKEKQERLHTMLYSMTVTIDYKKLYGLYKTFCQERGLIVAVEKQSKKRKMKKNET